MHGETVSMAVYNDKGYYGVKKGIVFSFPCECKDGNWYVKSGLSLSDMALEKLEITETELLEERDAAHDLLSKTSSRFRAYSSASSTMSLTSMAESDTELSTGGQFFTSRI